MTTTAKFAYLLPSELRRMCGHDSRSVADCTTCEAADYIEATQQPKDAQPGEGMGREEIRKILRHAPIMIAPAELQAIAATIERLYDEVAGLQATTRVCREDAEHSATRAEKAEAELAALRAQVAEGKQQWDRVAAAIGANGDDVDAVFAKAAQATAQGEAATHVALTTCGKFTVALFDADKVPPGSPVYTAPAPQAEQAPLEPVESWLPSGSMAPLEHSERLTAEQAYTLSAFDYERDPVGSRDWQLYWKGWWHRFLARAPGRIAQAEPGGRGFVLVSRELLEDAADKVRRYAETVQRCVKADDLEFPHYVPAIEETADDLQAALAAASPAPGAAPTAPHDALGATGS